MNTNKVIASNLIKIAKELIAGTDNPLDSKEFKDFVNGVNSTKEPFGIYTVEFAWDNKKLNGDVTGFITCPTVNLPPLKNSKENTLKQNLDNAKKCHEFLQELCKKLGRAIDFCKEQAEEFQNKKDFLPVNVKKALGMGVSVDDLEREKVKYQGIDFDKIKKYIHSSRSDLSVRVIKYEKRWGRDTLYLDILGKAHGGKKLFSNESYQRGKLFSVQRWCDGPLLEDLAMNIYKKFGIEYIDIEVEFQ